MSIQQSLMLSIRLSCYGLIIVLMLLCCPIFIYSIDANVDFGNQQGSSDSLNIKPDSLKQKLLRAYRGYRVETRFETYKVNWLNDNYDVMLKLYKSEVADNEVFDFSKALYLKYYMNKVELHNFYDFAYLYMDLKQAQNNKGAIQLSIPLPNFSRVFNKKMTYRE
jgi:hypothetical protein